MVSVEGPGGVTWLEVRVPFCVQDPRPGALTQDAMRDQRFPSSCDGTGGPEQGRSQRRGPRGR